MERATPWAAVAKANSAFDVIAADVLLLIVEPAQFIDRGKPPIGVPPHCHFLAMLVGLLPVHIDAVIHPGPHQTCRRIIPGQILQIYLRRLVSLLRVRCELLPTIEQLVPRWYLEQRFIGFGADNVHFLVLRKA